MKTDDILYEPVKRFSGQIMRDITVKYDQENMEWITVRIVLVDEDGNEAVIENAAYQDSGP